MTKYVDLVSRAKLLSGEFEFELPLGRLETNLRGLRSPGLPNLGYPDVDVGRR